MSAMLKRVWAFLMAPGTTLAFATVVLVGLGVDGHRGLSAAMMFLVMTLTAETHIMGWPRQQGWLWWFKGWARRTPRLGRSGIQGRDAEC